METAPGSPTISPERISKCVTPLRLIFWGGLLCLFDFHFSSESNGHGFRFDILNDFVGMVLVTIGVFRIAMLRLDERRVLAMILVGAVAIVSTLGALLGHFIFPRPEILNWAEILLSLAELAAIMLFCAAMRSYSLLAGLRAAGASWKMTLILFLVIYAVPLGFLHIAVLVAMATGSEFNINLGPAGLLLLPVFFWPLVHFFVSTSRMSDAAAEALEGARLK